GAVFSNRARGAALGGRPPPTRRSPGAVLDGRPWKKGHKRGAVGARIFHKGGIRLAKRGVAWPSGNQRKRCPEAMGNSRRLESLFGRGAGVWLAGAGGIASLASRAACQWSGSRSPSCPAGLVGKRVSTSCRYVHGSTPGRWHVDVKLNGTAAV